MKSFLEFLCGIPILIENPTFIPILTKLSRKLKEFSRFDCICKCYDFVIILLL